MKKLYIFCLLFFFALSCSDCFELTTDFAPDGVTLDQLINENDLPEVLKDLRTGLVSLDLSFQQLINIDNLNQIPGITKIHELDLEGNYLTHLPNLSFLKNLEILDLSFNNLKTLPDLTNLKQLTELYLYGNPLNRRTIEDIDYLTEKNPDLIVHIDNRQQSQEPDEEQEAPSDDETID